MDISPWITMRDGVAWWLADTHIKTYSSFTANDRQPLGTSDMG